MNAATWSWLALATRLHRRDHLDPPDAALAGLVIATGPDGYILAELPPVARDRLRHLLDRASPPLRELLAHTGSAIARRRPRVPFLTGRPA